MKFYLTRDGRKGAHNYKLFRGARPYNAGDVTWYHSTQRCVLVFRMDARTFHQLFSRDRLKPGECRMIDSLSVRYFIRMGGE